MRYYSPFPWTFTYQNKTKKSFLEKITFLPNEIIQMSKLIFRRTKILYTPLYNNIK